MKQSGFDELLKQKMDDLMIDPPSGMWDSIQAQLKDIPAPTPPVKAAKPLSFWAVRSVAAAAVIGSIVASFFFFHSPEPTATPLVITDSVQSPASDGQLIEPPATFTRVVHNRRQKSGYVVDTLDQVGPIFRPEPGHPKQEPEPKPEPPTKVEPQQKGYNPPSIAKAKRAKRIHTLGLYAANFGGRSSGEGTQHTFANTQYDEITKDYQGINFVTSPEASSTIGVRHDAPITAGVSFLWQTSPRLGVETGVMYSYLRSEFTIGTSLSTAKRIQELHYVGVPLSVKYDIFYLGKVSIYGKAGGKIEWAVAAKNKFDKSYYDGAMVQQHSANIETKGVVPSVNVAVGGEYHISPQFGLYFEPSANYYFPTNSQPENYRTDNNVSLSFGAGLRIRIR